MTLTPGAVVEAGLGVEAANLVGEVFRVIAGTAAQNSCQLNCSTFPHGTKELTWPYWNLICFSILYPI